MREVDKAIEWQMLKIVPLDFRENNIWGIWLCQGYWVKDKNITQKENSMAQQGKKMKDITANKKGQNYASTKENGQTMAYCFIWLSQQTGALQLYKKALH